MPMDVIANKQVSLENGLILSYDSRTLSSSMTTGKKSTSRLSTAQPKYTLSAHDGGAAALDINPHIRGCIATGGMDKTVKVWNVADDETEGMQGRKREISLATSRDLGVVCLSLCLPGFAFLTLDENLPAVAGSIRQGLHSRHMRVQCRREGGARS